MTNTVASPDVSPFPSFAAMRTAHAALLRLYRGSGASPSLLDQADGFIRQGSATGALIDDYDDRMSAQSLLDYWSAVLSRADRPPTHAFLDEFNPDLAPDLPDSLCPYVGLDAFGETQNRLFFGREQVLNDALAQLRDQHLLVVVGPLGSGKSSLVFGSLIPALKADRLPGSASWRYLPELTPGTEPLRNLARAVGLTVGDAQPAPDPAAIVRAVDAGGEQAAVIVVDRFEELFTLCSAPELRDAFTAALLGITASPKSHIVLLTLRSDFEAQIAAVPELHERFAHAAFRLPPLSASELRDAICRPAEQVGLKFEAGLVDRLVKEILGEPAGLPLLQFTLLKLWDLRDHNRLTLDAYRKVGGGRQALARAADELYESLQQPDRDTLRTLMTLMVRPAPENEIVTACIRPDDAYAKADRASVDRVLDRLVKARLVRRIQSQVDTGPTFELAHAALVWNWPRMVEWLDEERIATRRRVRLTSAAEHWNSYGRDPGGLLRGSLLDEAKSYTDLSPTEKAFVDASAAAIAAAAAEEERRRNREIEQARALMLEQQRRADEQARAAAAMRQKNRSLRAMTGATVVLLLIAVIGWIVADRARREAERKQHTVEALMEGRGVVVDNSATRPTSGGGGSSPIAAAPPNAVAAPPQSTAAASIARPAPAGTAPIDPGRIASQVHLRASRRPTGREIAGTELPSYAFAVWAEGPPEVLAAIESIQYEFNHPTFQQKVQIGRNRSTGFRVGYTGWGCLSSVMVTLRLRDTSATPPHVDFDMCGAIDDAARARD